MNKHSREFLNIDYTQAIENTSQDFTPVPCVLERSVWAPLSWPLSIYYFSSGVPEKYDVTFAWNVSSSSDCSTKTQRPSKPRHSPNRFPNFSVCSCWVCFQLSWEAAAWPPPLRRIPLGSQRRARHRRAGRLTKKGYFHVRDIGTFPGVATLYEKWGPSGAILLQHVLWYFGNSWKSLGREKWVKIKCPLAKAIILAEQTNVCICI